MPLATSGLGGYPGKLPPHLKIRDPPTSNAPMPAHIKVGLLGQAVTSHGSNFMTFRCQTILESREIEDSFRVQSASVFFAAYEAAFALATVRTRSQFVANGINPKLNGLAPEPFSSGTQVN